MKEWDLTEEIRNLLHEDLKLLLDADLIRIGRNPDGRITITVNWNRIDKDPYLASRKEIRKMLKTVQGKHPITVSERRWKKPLLDPKIREYVKSLVEKVQKSEEIRRTGREKVPEPTEILKKLEELGVIEMREREGEKRVYVNRERVKEVLSEGYSYLFQLIHGKSYRRVSYTIALYIEKFLKMMEEIDEISKLERLRIMEQNGWITIKGDKVHVSDTAQSAVNRIEERSEREKMKERINRMALMPITKAEIYAKKNWNLLEKYVKRHVREYLGKTGTKYKVERR